jgi:hypothetical protein
MGTDNLRQSTGESRFQVHRPRDNESLYYHASMRALSHAERWSTDKIAPLYEAFFKSVGNQPEPSFVPKGFR